MKKNNIAFCSLIMAVLLVFSPTMYAFKELVHAKNETGSTITVLFRAIGCGGATISSNVNTIKNVCMVATVRNGEFFTYEFGGGTSGRYVTVGVPEGTEDMLGTSYYETVDLWNTYYLGNSFFISYDADPNNGQPKIGSTDGCDQKYDVGTNKEAYVTWTAPIKVFGDANNNFFANCEYNHDKF